jgi:ADP-ribose pyrophosphatase
VVALRSFRHAVRRWCVEIPRGAKLPGEALEACALREAREECGVVLTPPSQVIDLGSLEPDTGIIAADVPVFVITNCTIDESKVNRDISESTLGPVVLSRENLRQMIRERTIKDALLLAALTQAQVEGYWNW